MLAGRTTVDNRSYIEGILVDHRFGHNSGSHRIVGCNLRIAGTVGIGAGKSPHPD